MVYAETIATHESANQACDEKTTHHGHLRPALHPNQEHIHPIKPIPHRDLAGTIGRDEDERNDCGRD